MILRNHFSFFSFFLSFFFVFSYRMTSIEKHFYTAAVHGNVEKIKKILTENPDLNVNRKFEIYSNFTALHAACENDHGKVVAMMLARPDILVNQKDEFGWSAFITACSFGSTACVQLMLKDFRVEVDDPDRDGRTPFWRAAQSGSLEVVKVLIASGRELGLKRPGYGYDEVIQVAKNNNYYEVVSLLETFKKNPKKTRYEVGLEIDCLDRPAANIFALVVFLCDGLLDLIDQTQSSEVRFFKIAKQLPLELQMILCHRMVGSSGDNIPGEIREVGFRDLVCDLLP